MDTVVALRGDILPRPRRTMQLTPERIDRSNKHLVDLVRRRSDTPVVLGLANLKLVRKIVIGIVIDGREDLLLPRRSVAAPEERITAGGSKHVRDIREIRDSIDAEPQPCRRRLRRQGNGCEGAAAVIRLEQPCGERGEDLDAPTLRMDANVPAVA